MEVLDPAGTMREAFCDEAEERSNQRKVIEEIVRGALDSKEEVEFKRLEYGFPIFDDAFTKAVVIASVNSVFWSPDVDDASLQSWGGKREPYEGRGAYAGMQGHTVALVFHKRSGTWRLIKTEDLASWN